MDNALKQRAAVLYQSLYLMNLLLIPGIAFIVLAWFYHTRRHQIGLQRFHLYRALQLSILAGILLLVVPLSVVYLSSQFDASVMAMIMYFVTAHASLVLVGMLNIARAMSNKMPLF